MAEQRVERRLSAILAADIAGYSALDLRHIKLSYSRWSASSADGISIRRILAEIHSSAGGSACDDRRSVQAVGGMSGTVRLAGIVDRVTATSLAMAAPKKDFLARPLLHQIGIGACFAIRAHEQTI